MLERLQEGWEVRTATDSDDDREGRSEEEDGLSLGDGSDDDEDGDGEDGSFDGEDGDEEGGYGFSAMYAEALEAQLRGTTLGQTYEEDQEGPGAQGPGIGSGAPGRAGRSAAGAAEGEGGPGEGGLQPINLDVNLVKNLMKSVGFQEGLSGPASNLAGLLGLRLPVVRPGQEVEVEEEPM